MRNTTLNKRSTKSKVYRWMRCWLYLSVENFMQIKRHNEITRLYQLNLTLSPQSFMEDIFFDNTGKIYNL
jgi:hypothetical protein